MSQDNDSGTMAPDSFTVLGRWWFFVIQNAAVLLPRTPQDRTEWDLLPPPCLDHSNLLPTFDWKVKLFEGQKNRKREVTQTRTQGTALCVNESRRVQSIVKMSRWGQGSWRNSTSAYIYKHSIHASCSALSVSLFLFGCFWFRVFVHSCLHAEEVAGLKKSSAKSFQVAAAQIAVPVVSVPNRPVAIYWALCCSVHRVPASKRRTTKTNKNFKCIKCYQNNQNIPIWSVKPFSKITCLTWCYIFFLFRLNEWMLAPPAVLWATFWSHTQKNF